MDRYILQVYNLDNNKVSGLLNYNNIVRERDLKTGGDTLSFSYPKKSEKTKYLKEEHYIETKDNRYVIKEVDKSAKNWVRVVCKVDKDGLKQRIFPHFEMVNSQLGDTLNLALAGTGWTIGHNDITKRRTVRLAWCTPLEIIEEIRKVYRAEIFFNARDKQINVYEQYGEDKGQFFMENVNLKDLSITSDTHDYITRLIPLGKDGLMIDEINNGKNYLENYQYSNKIIYGVWEDNRYSVVENLKEDGEAKLEELSKPLISYEGNSIDLRGADLGDTIELVSKTNNVKTKQRVVKITEYPLKPHENKVEIANKIMSFQEQFNETEEVVEKADTVMTSDGMIDESKVDFNPIRQEFEHIIAQKADIVDLNAANARIGNLEVTKANMTDVEIVNARIDNLYAEDLSAINADIINLQARVGEIDTILSMEVFAELIEVGEIRAGSGIIADGAIGDAQISYLTAGKIVSGTIDTSLVTVAGADGKLNITGNRLQVINDGKERVALGDVNRDGSVYGLRVRGEDGETVLFDERGVTREGITEGSIDDSKVGDDANIQGHKLDINSVIREVNDEGTETIKGTRVQVGDRTLDVELSTIQSNIDNIEIGGRNFVKNSDFNNGLEDWDNWGTANREIVVDDSGKNWIHIWQDDEQSFRGIRQNIYHFEKATDYTVSFMACKTKDSEGGAMILFHQRGFDGNAPSVEKIFTVSTEPKRYSFTFKSTDRDKEYFNIMVGGQRKIPFDIYITDIKFEKGNKATDWTPAPEDFTAEIIHQRALIQALDDKILLKVDRQEFTQYRSTTDEEIGLINTQLSKNTSSIDILQEQIKLKVEQVDINNAVSELEGQINTELTQINTQLAEIDINLNSITSRVQETEYDIDNVTNKVTILEQTVEDFSISIRKYEDGIFEGATYTFDGRNATFRAAGLKIQNDFGADVLKADTLGNLSIVGDFTTYVDGNRAIHVTNRAVRFHNYYDTGDNKSVGSIYAAKRLTSEAEPGLAIAHNQDSRLSLLYRRDGNSGPYIDFDANNVLGNSSKYPIYVYQPTLFSDDIYISRGIQLGAHNRIYWGEGARANQMIFRVPTAPNTGYRVMEAGGSVVQTYNPTASPRFRFNRSARFTSNLEVGSNLRVDGSKNALVETENYGKRLLNALETPEYYFQDRGSGKTGEDGYCYIYVDDIFNETVNTDMQYHVEIQEYGEGTLRPIERNPRYFVIKGTPNLEFGWILTAKRKDYEYHRLETPVDLEEQEEINIDYLIENEEEKETDEELENIVEEELTFDLADYVLGGDE